MKHSTKRSNVLSRIKYQARREGWKLEEIINQDGGILVAIKTNIIKVLPGWKFVKRNRTSNSANSYPIYIMWYSIPFTPNS